MAPTIVLVHGAFAESASWDRVIRHLLEAGHRVVAAANPLGGLAADVADGEAARMAATQRPATLEALEEPAGERPLWKQLPSWFLIGELDRNIPAALQRFMAYRAGARRTVQIPGASHAIAVSHPEATARLILDAAAVQVAA
jgi:pimeloyl-ACP methyl ester carboxylesterase